MQVEASIWKSLKDHPAIIHAVNTNPIDAAKFFLSLGLLLERESQQQAIRAMIAHALASSRAEAGNG